MGVFDYAITNAGIILAGTYCFASSPRAFEEYPVGGLAGVLFCASVGAGFVVAAKREIIQGLDEMTLTRDIGWGPGPGSDVPNERG